MSLINRMLRELSAREPTPNVMSGIQLGNGPRRRRGRGARAVLFLVLIAAFTVALWALFGQRPQAPPVAQAPPPPPPTAPPETQRPHRFRLDTEFAAPATPPALAAPPSRRASPRALAPSVEPPKADARTEAPARDRREAVARHGDAAQALVRGERRTAEDGFREALALDPRHHEAREALAALLLDQNRLAEAQALIDDGLALAPGRAAFVRLAARLDLASGQPASALARLEPSPPPAASDPEYHGLLASAYQRLGRHEQASRAYQVLLQAQPGVAQWWAAYGLSRDALGDAPGALSAYAQARQLGRLDPRVLEHINRRTAALQAPG